MSKQKPKALITDGLRFGRFPITAVQPAVDGGKFPAKAVVGETLVVGATAFREGHDQLGVSAVLLDPARQGTPACPSRPAPRQPRQGNRPLGRPADPDRHGQLVLRDRSLARPLRHLAPQRRGQGGSRHRRRTHAGRRRRAAHRSVRGLLAPVRRPADAADGRRRAQRRREDPGGAPRRRVQPGGGRRRRPPADPRTGHRLRELPPAGGARARQAGVPGTNSSPGPRVPSATTPPASGPPAPSAPPPSGSTPSRPWVSTSSTCRRSTRSASSTARAPTTP